MSKLSDALDHLQAKLDDSQLIDYTDHEELESVLNAAWKYYDLGEEDE